MLLIMTDKPLPAKDLNRYRRQTAFPPLGELGQRRLEATHALIVGCGALGGTVAILLARAGIGRLTLIDPDTVSVDNLHRQIAFTGGDARTGRPKVEAARATLDAVESATAIDIIARRFDETNADSLVAAADIIFDGCDNFETRFVINRAAIRHRKPLVSGGVAAARGQVMAVLPGRTPCLACLLGDDETRRASESIDDVGVIAPVVQIVAAMQAAEAFKIIATGACQNLPAVSGYTPALYMFDLWQIESPHNAVFRTRPLDAYIPCRVCREATS